MSGHSRTILNPPALFWKHGEGIGCGAYVSPNVTDMVFNATYRQLDSIDVWTTLRTRWVNETDYWTSCVPRDMIWEGFLEPLARLVIVAETSGDRTWYRLQNADEWDNVESTLAYTYSTMCKIGLLTTLDFLYTPWPYTFDYVNRSFPTHREAKTHFTRARAAFAATVGLLSFFTISLNRQPRHWLERVADRKILPPALIDEISNSIICRSEYRDRRPCHRAGMVIPMDETVSLEMQSHVKAIIERFGVPVYLYYGKQRWTHHPTATHFLPPMDKIELVQSLPASNEVSTLLPNRAPSAPTSADTSNPASSTHRRPDPITRQIPGQTWEDFMKAEEVYCKKQLQDETLSYQMCDWAGKGSNEVRDAFVMQQRRSLC